MTERARMFNDLSMPLGGVMRILFRIVISFVFVAVSAHAVEIPPRNPFLADSVYPLGHGDSAQQDALPVAGPEDPGATFKLGPGTPLERAVLDFCAAVRKGSPDYDDAALGRDVVLTLEQLDKQIL